MDPMITPPPIVHGALLHRRDSSSSTSSTLDTCGYLSGDYGMIRRIHPVPFPSFLFLFWPEVILLTTNEMLSKPIL